MKLLNGIPWSAGNGDHLYTVIANGGTAKLQHSVGGEDMQDVPSSLVSADSGLIVTLKSQPVQAVLTGNAVAYLEEI